MVYSADINGQTVKMNDYVATEEGGKWYVDASAEPAYILKSAQSVTSADDENVAMTYQITAKETNATAPTSGPAPSPSLATCRPSRTLCWRTALTTTTTPMAA